MSYDSHSGCVVRQSNPFKVSKHSSFTFRKVITDYNFKPSIPLRFPLKDAFPHFEQRTLHIVQRLQTQTVYW